MQKVPEIAGRDLTLTAMSGGITNRNFLVDAAGTDQRWVIRLAGNDTHLLGISPRGRARRDGHRGGRRRRSRGDRVHPARGLPGHPVHRGHAGLATRPSTGPRRSGAVADSLRRIHDGPAIPGLFVPLRIVEAYRALAMERGVPIPPEYDLRRGRRAADRARLPGRPDRAAAVPQRPAQRQLHRRRRRASGSSIGSTPGWATRSSTSATSASTTS